MRVGVESDSDVCVSERLLGHLGVGADREHQGCAGVPQIMETYFRKLGTLEERLEGSGHEVVAAHGRAYPCWEHEAVVLPESCDFFPLLELTFTVSAPGHGPLDNLDD